MKKVVYEGIYFNATWAASKSVEEFIAHEKHQALTEGQLREAHALCVEEVKPKEVKKEDKKLK